MKGKKYYAYHLVDEGKQGITYTWPECQEVTKGKKARYKSFKSEAEAKEWLVNGGIYETKAARQEKLPEGIYFDAGTGRGIGVEVRVTKLDGISILHQVVPHEKINKYGNYLAEPGKTNNFGELLGLFCAMKIALESGEKNIYGDSKLVIEYWSKGMIKNTVDKETRELAFKVKRLREKYEAQGGKISHVSGDLNPADLGFH